MEHFKSVGDLIDHLHALTELPNEPYHVSVNTQTRLCTPRVLSLILRDLTDYRVVAHTDASTVRERIAIVHIGNVGLEDLVRGTV